MSAIHRLLASRARARVLSLASIGRAAIPSALIGHAADRGVTQRIASRGKARSDARVTLTATVAPHREPEEANAYLRTIPRDDTRRKSRLNELLLNEHDPFHHRANAKGAGQGGEGGLSMKTRTRIRESPPDGAN